MKKFIYYILIVAVVIGYYSYETRKSERASSFDTPQEALLAQDPERIPIPAYLHDNEALFFFIQAENYLGASFVNKNSFGWKLSREQPLVPFSLQEKVYRAHAIDNVFVFGLLPKGQDYHVKVAGIEAENVPLITAEEIRANYPHLLDASIWYVIADDFLPDKYQIELFDQQTGEQVPAKFLF